jgi:L-lysine 2,3-aminomutase
MLDYLRRPPGVRDVVVSGGDVANMPWKNLESFVDRLLEIDNIRDIRLATKALMGLPQHWLQDEVVAGMDRSRPPAVSAASGLAIHTHVNSAQSVTPLVAEATKAMLDAGVRDVRNQGVLMRGVNDSSGTQLLDLCFALLDGAGDHALLLLHVRHDPVHAEHWRLSVAEAQALQHGIMGYLPGLRHAAHRVRRAVRRQALGAPGRVLRRGAASRTGRRTTAPASSRRRRGAVAHVRVLRPDPHAAGVRSGLVARARDHQHRAVGKVHGDVDPPWSD